MTVIPREAASLIILTGTGAETHVLMGRRADTARFMPNYLVFPGGAVDEDDGASVTRGFFPTRFHAAALRETWEETSVMIGSALNQENAILETEFGLAYHRAGLRPEGSKLIYAARAITPESSPIRFDTRFFVTGTDFMVGAPRAFGELPEVAWLPIATALSHPNVSGVTRFALSEALRRWGAEALDRASSDPIKVYTYQQNVRVIEQEPVGQGLL